MNPIAFKVRTQGRYNGMKGGAIKPGGGGAGALWYEDKTFTVATHQDQWILAPMITHNEPRLTHPVLGDCHSNPNPIRYLSVCSGMEAATVAWHPLGWEPVGFSEIEPFPCAILAHRFPNTKNYGSLTEYHTWNIEPGSIDLLVGGTPCQSFSVAGLRKGLEDPRGNLALVFLGLADRIKPRWIVWENVPGVLSSNGGRDFGSFLGALRELGYGFAYRVLDAQHFGVPQRRRRVFVVAHLGDWRPAAEVLFEPDCVRRDPKKGKQAGQGVAARAQGGVGADGGKLMWSGSDQANAERLIDKAGTLNCDQGQRVGYICPLSHWYGGPHPTLNQSSKSNGATPMAVRRLTPVECERLQGFPDNWSRIPWKGKPEEDCPDGPRYKACGNSMAVPVMRWIGSRIQAFEEQSK